MNIPPKINQPSSQLPDLCKNSNVSAAGSVLFNVGNKKIKIKKSKIKTVTKGLAEIAFSMGETNNVEEYAEQMAEDIYEAMQLSEKKLNKKSSKKKK